VVLFLSNPPCLFPSFLSPFCICIYLALCYFSVYLLLLLCSWCLFVCFYFRKGGCFFVFSVTFLAVSVIENVCFPSQCVYFFRLFLVSCMCLCCFAASSYVLFLFCCSYAHHFNLSTSLMPRFVTWRPQGQMSAGSSLIARRRRATR